MRLVRCDDEVGRVGCYEARWRRFGNVVRAERVGQANAVSTRPVLPKTHSRGSPAIWNHKSPTSGTAVHDPFKQPSEKPSANGLRVSRVGSHIGSVSPGGSTQRTLSVAPSRPAPPPRPVSLTSR